MKLWTSGAVPPRSEGDYVYVERPCDRDIWHKIENPKHDKILALYGSRASGKSSFLARLEDRAKSTYRVARVEVDRVFSRDSSLYPNEMSILDALLPFIAEAADCHSQYQQWLDRISSENALAVTNVDLRFREFIENVLAPDEHRRVLLLLDEFDRFVSFGPTWLFLLRCLDNHVRSPLADRVRIVFASLLSPAQLVPELDATAGKWLMLDGQWVGDFNPRDSNVLRTLARALKDPPGPDEESAALRVLNAAGGHPYLTISLLGQVLEGGTWSDGAVDAVVANYIGRNITGPKRLSGPRDDHFNFAKSYIAKSGELGSYALDIYARLRAGDRQFHVDQQIQNVLYGAGLVSLDSGSVRVKSEIVKNVFDDTWINEVKTAVLDMQSKNKRAFSNSVAIRTGSEELPRVLILNIGGTLGMDYGPDDKVLEPATPERFLSDVPEVYNLVNPIVERPFPPRDGANIAPPQWRMLAEKIDSYRDSDLSGVVVISGTDTMAYTASAVAFALQKTLKFPVAFVGAQARRKRLFADASPNLLRALAVAREGSRLAQVVIVFNDQIFRAVRADKRDDFRYDGFWAPTEGPLAVFVEDIKYQVDPETLREDDSDAATEPRINFEEKILTISQRPGLQPELYLPLLDPNKVKGVLIESLGVGNLPTVEDYSFEILIKSAIQKNIPVLIASRYPVQPELAAFYAPATEFLHLAPEGVMSAGDMVPPAATVKFMWAIAEIRRRFEKRENVDNATRLRALRDLMNANLVGEIRRKEPPKRSA